MAGRFRLAGLLRLRNLQEEQAAAALALAHAERRAAQKRRDETAEMLSGTGLPERADHLTWQAAIAGRAAVNGLLGEARAALEVVEVRVDAATHEWSAARTKAATLEKLEDRHEVLERAEELRAEQLVLDEAASRQRAADLADAADVAEPGTPAGTHRSRADDAVESPRTATPKEDR